MNLRPALQVVVAAVVAAVAVAQRKLCLVPE